MLPGYPARLDSLVTKGPAAYLITSLSLSAHGGPRVGRIRAGSAGAVVARCES